jgi:hypothetical protein
MLTVACTLAVGPEDQKNGDFWSKLKMAIKPRAQTRWVGTIQDEQKQCGFKHSCKGKS